jgi:hypothetical protein
MAIAGVQVRHPDLQRLWMLLIFVGKLVLFQSHNEWVNFFYVVQVYRFRRKNLYRGSVFRP